MIRIVIFIIVSLIGSLVALCGTGLAVTKNVDIVVTHGAGPLLTTYTVLNNSASPSPAGAAYIAGQAFRRGDLPPGTHPVFRDPTTHVPLVQQLDEIATRRENGDDKSIRHLVFSVQLPSIPAHGTYTMEIVKESGDYVTPPGKQTLAGLCAAHDLKLVYTDVRNQDDTVRDSGTMVSRVCDAINNVGRDAPRRVAQGPVRDSFIAVGSPVYNTSGNKDPLIYTEWYIDLTTNPSDQTSLGPVRHVALTMNPWLNVKAGSPGGGPGPNGFANDPQVVSYRPTLIDGSSTLIDWSWLDKTIASSSNPILLNGTPYNGCGSYGVMGVNGQWTIPGSIGQNAWYHTMAVRYTTDGAPPAGMTANRIYFVNAAGNQYTNQDANNGTKVYLARVPLMCTSQVPDVTPTTEGAGNQIFSFRIWHNKWNGWFSWAQDAKENWTSGTARTVSNLYPAFTQAEQGYWKQTGAILPFKTNPTTDYTFNYIDFNTPFYTPMGIGNMGGGGGGGERSPLGTQSDYVARAFTTELPREWDLLRLSAASYEGNQTYGLMRDEATGRVPIFNNGRPGPNHGGAGTPYTEGSTTFPLHPGTVAIFGNTNMDGLAIPRQNTPEANYQNYATSAFVGVGNDHAASFTNGWYQFHGSRQALNAVYDYADRSLPNISTGDLITFHQTSTINGVRYYGLHNACCQVRGSYWVHRDVTIGAAFGSDSNVERTYYNDLLQENYWHWIALENFVNGGTTGNFSSVFTTPYYEVNPSTFKNVYGHITMAQSWALLRDPLSGYFIPRFVQEHLTRCSDTVPGSYSSYYCGGFNWIGNIRDATHVKDCGTPVSPYCPNVGQYFANDASEYGEATDYWCWNTTGDPTVVTPQNNHDMLASNGDKIKNPQSNVPEGVLGDLPDQINDRNFWYTITNVVKNSGGGVDSFKIINPATGTPFTSYTRGGTASSMCGYLKLRPTDPADSKPTGSFSSYSAYSIAAIKMLLAIGHTEIQPAYDKMTARGIEDRGGTPKLTFDSSVTIP